MSKLIQRMTLLMLSLGSSWVSAQAVPPVTLSFQNGVTTFATGATGSANYLVSMDLLAPPGLSLSLSQSDYSWITQVTTGTSACAPPVASICATHFTLSPGSSCCLMLSLNGAGVAAGSYDLEPMVASNPAAYAFKVVSPTQVTVSGASAPVLTQSVSTLALSVEDTTTNAALTGNPRQVTITNSSLTTTATNVTFSSTVLPENTTITSNATPSSACGDIEPSGTCVLTIKPGATPSAAAYDLNPTPITVTIVGENTDNPLTLPVSILTYGSVHQSGYVYSIDDSAPTTGSVKGTVAALQDASAALLWSSNGTDGQPSYDLIPGISVLSETGNQLPAYAAASASFNNTYANEVTFPFPPSGSFSSCKGNTDGACNSANILTLYNAYVTNYGIGTSPYALSAGPTTPALYAAGLCSSQQAGGSGWYLPAICEMSYKTEDGDETGCGTAVEPTLQNMASNLPSLFTTEDQCNNTPAGCFSRNEYWSSTAGDFSDEAWYQFFSSEVGANSQYTNSKQQGYYVRCSKAF